MALPFLCLYLGWDLSQKPIAPVSFEPFEGLKISAFQKTQAKDLSRLKYLLFQNNLKFKSASLKSLTKYSSDLTYYPVNSSRSVN